MQPPTLATTPAKTFSATRLGEQFVRQETITARHVDDGAALIRDFNPLHVDADFAARSRFGGRILHGVLTSALMGAELGMVYAGTAIAYLEHNARFLAPVKIGDTLTITWTVVELQPKPQHGGGIVVAEAVALNQDGVEVCRASGKMLVGDSPVASP
jgi:acyl dehydratase